MSAILAGAHAIVEGLDDPDQNNEMLYLLYLIKFTQEHADKVRLIFDESVTKLRHAASVAAYRPALDQPFTSPASAGFFLCAPKPLSYVCCRTDTQASYGHYVLDNMKQFLEMTWRE